MFNTMSKAVVDQMQALEAQDAEDRQNGTPQIERLRQIPPETGKFLALMAAASPENGAWLEIGTSGGYSALWIAQAAQLRDKQLITFELLPDKVKIARKTFKDAKIGETVELINGDARGHIKDYEEIAFCFLDAEKEMYDEFYDLVAPRLVPGGILVADNVTSHAEHLQPLVDKAEADPSLDAMVATIGKGLLVCRKL